MKTTVKGAGIAAERAFGLFLILAGFAAPACAPRDAGLGATVRHNMALHAIDPRPTYKGEPIEGASGERAAAAHERYRTGTVKPPQTIQTTSSPARQSSREQP